MLSRVCHMYLATPYTHFGALVLVVLLRLLFSSPRQEQLALKPGDAGISVAVP